MTCNTIQTDDIVTNAITTVAVNATRVHTPEITVNDIQITQDQALKIVHLDPSYEGAVLIVEGPAEFESITGAFNTTALTTPVVETDTLKFDDLWLSKYEHTR